MDGFKKRLNKGRPEGASTGTQERFPGREAGDISKNSSKQPLCPQVPRLVGRRAAGFRLSHRCNFSIHNGCDARLTPPAMERETHKKREEENRGQEKEGAQTLHHKRKAGKHSANPKGPTICSCWQDKARSVLVGTCSRLPAADFIQALRPAGRREGVSGKTGPSRFCDSVPKQGNSTTHVPRHPKNKKPKRNDSFAPG